MECKEYEKIVFNNSAIKDKVEQGLEITKKAIIKNNLILVGGMAMDLALRTKGKNIYPDDTLPDYDFICPNFHVIAYDIAKECLKQKLTNIQVINAQHVSTMRVRTDFEVIADSTYVPENIYKRIPYIKTQGIRVVHPWFQMIDQHRSLSLPYENPPMETINHRWKKDMERYDLLYQSFPLPDVELKIRNYKTVEIPLELFKDECLAGFPALLYWAITASKEGFKLKPEYECLGNFKLFEQTLLISLPEGTKISIYSDDASHMIFKLQKFMKDFKPAKIKHKFEATMTKETKGGKETKNKVNYFNAFLDKLPQKAEYNIYEVFDNYGQLLSAHKWGSIHVVNLQNVMLYLLLRFVMSDCKVSLLGYHLAREIIEWADDKKYMPSAEYYGNKNIGHAYIEQRKKFLSAIGEREPDRNKPKRIYPENISDIPEKIYKFDPASSDIYQFDGEPITKLEKHFEF